MSINVWTFDGRLTNTPKTREVNGSTVCNFNVAINNYAGKDKGHKATFVECAVWGERGKYLLNFDKGVEITITGKHEVRLWTDKDGVERTAIACMVFDYSVHSKAEPDEVKEEPAAPKPKPIVSKRPVEVEVEDEEDIPF